ncbi:CapA family protein [bacterium]|nr:CapA family protein [bacterium]
MKSSALLRSAAAVLLFAVSGVVAAAESTTVRLGFTGDIFLGSWATAYIDTFGVDYPFEKTRDLFHEMDLVVGNLENPVTPVDEPYLEKTFYLKAEPGVTQGLYNANIRAVTLANNHILDYGVQGLRDTMAELDGTGIQHFGAGMNKTEALQEAAFEFNGQTVALLGFSATFPEEFWASDTSAGTAFPYEQDLIRKVDECAAAYDIVVTVFHWGAEKRETPKDYQVDLAHLCIDHGADFVVGHHPHVPQGIEIYKDTPIFYSLGNFAFASYSETAKVGLIADITFEDGKVSEARVVPVNVYNVEVRFRPVPLDDQARIEFIHYLDAIPSEYITNAKLSINGSVVIE